MKFGLGSRRLRLRARLTLAFGLGALLLSVLLSVVTYGLVRTNLVESREESARSVAVVNADQASRRITAETNEDAVRALLGNLRTVADGVPMLRLDSQWVSANPVAFAAPGDINAQLLSLVTAPGSAPGEMRYRLQNGDPYLVIGVPLPNRQSVYFEATPLGDVEDTLDQIGLALGAASAVTTLAGVSLGAWASRRVLAPLEGVSDTAKAISTGDLAARLDVEDDLDLAPLGQSFNDMASNLEERIERDAQFASNVSHELRSPLMTIMASLEILESRRGELSERGNVALDLLSSDLERFRHLVEDLLEISRYDVGGHALDADFFGVVEFVSRVAEGVNHRDVPIHHDNLEELVIEADKRRLARVFTNLLDNAAKYGGGATGVSIIRTGDDIEISVTDDGPGVPPTERQVIFGRFARGAEGGRRGAGTGTGLGLALAAEHVRLHGGRMSVTDREDGKSGACFRVFLPGVVR